MGWLNPHVRPLRALPVMNHPLRAIVLVLAALPLAHSGLVAQAATDAASIFSQVYPCETSKAPKVKRPVVANPIHVITCATFRMLSPLSPGAKRLQSSGVAA